MMAQPNNSPYPAMPSNQTKAFFNWSSGKDSALALYQTLQSGLFEVTTLFTNINRENDRVSMHGVPIELLKQQSKSMGIPLEILALPPDVDFAGYERYYLEKMAKLTDKGIDTAIFGDIFLEDIRDYRVKQLAKANMKAHFPLWGKSSRQVMDEFFAAGFKTVVTCVNADFLDQSFVGRVIDEDFIDDLPKNVDMCGENGEFHTFVFDGPLFREPINFTLGEKIYREYPHEEEDDPHHQFGTVKKSYGYWFCELLPIVTKSPSR